MDWLKKGIFLGFVFFLAVYLVKPIGVSTQFSVVSGILYHAVDRDLISEDDTVESGYSSSNEYLNREDGKLAKTIVHPWDYALVFVLAIPLGSFIAGALMRKKGDRDYIRMEREEYSGESSRQYLPSFFSGFLLLYGARMADGCTSGHMMSGMMQGSVSGYVFAGCAFAVAIPLAIGIKKKKKGRGASGWKLF